MKDNRPNNPSPFGNSGFSPKPGSGIKEVKSSRGIVWIKAIAIPISVVIIVMCFAILSGRNKPKPADWIYVHANNGKKSVDLPDGSKIMLRKGSSVSYPADYGKIRRYVKLTGEAYFEVQYNSSIPFSVKAISDITTDEGTSFFIRSNDSIEVVIVSKGKVKLEKDKDSGEFMVLSSGQKSELINNKLIRSSAGNDNSFAWKNEQLIFNQTPLIQVAEDINNFYGVPVKFKGDINPEKITVTAQFDNQPLLRILEEIGTKTNLLIKLNGDTVSISKQAEKVMEIHSEINRETQEIKNNEIMESSGKITPKAKKKKSWIKRIFSK